MVFDSTDIGRNQYAFQMLVFQQNAPSWQRKAPAEACDRIFATIFSLSPMGLPSFLPRNNCRASR